jgi:threonine synthase
MAQVVYYVTSAARLTGGAAPVSFAVPTGNFGNVFAGYGAQRMGLPVSQFVVASNANDILTRFLQSSVMEMAGVQPTLSPSMDIQVSSNFERLLYEIWGGDGAAVAEAMLRFRADGRFEVDDDRMGLLREHWSAASLDDDATIEVIRELHDRLGVLVDPHTAVGLGAATICRHDPSNPMVAMATAHPAKFPDAVEAAVGERPALPARLEGLFERPERYDTVPADYAAVRDAISAAIA